jgi:restriction system protein
MARRQPNIAIGVMTWTSRVPWWVGLVLALLSFVALRFVAGIEATPPNNVENVGGLVATGFVRAVASLLQWVLPVLFVVGAAVSAVNQLRRVSLHDDVAVDGTRRSLAQMSWQDFERVVNEYFRRREFSVTDPGRPGPDGGVDLVLTKGGEYYLVQCKRWRAVKVGVETVRELYGVMAARHAVGGFVVTSGAFTAEALKFAEGREVELINGKQLASAIKAQGTGTVVASIQDWVPATPECPACGSSMVRREAKQGLRAGSSFWGCSTFPRCRGTRPVAGR